MKYIFGLLALLCVIACNKPLSKNNKTENKIIPAASIDTSRYAILKFDKANNYYFDKNVTPATISSEEIERIEKLIDKAVANYNKDEEKVYEKNVRETREKFPSAIAYDGRIKKPFQYRKQIIAVINSKGEKIVWVNCFYWEGVDHSYWRKDIVSVEDGGNWFFNIKINLTKNTAYDLMVNGAI